MEEAKKAKMDDGERSGVASKSVSSLICVSSYHQDLIGKY